MDFIDTKTFDVSSAPSPFAVASDFKQFPLGMTIEDIVNLNVPNKHFKQYTSVHIGGHFIDRVNWHRVRPKQGQLVTIRAVPQGGGGGKNPLATVLSIALMAAVPALGFGVAQTLGLGWTTAGGTFIASSVGLAIGKGIVAIGGRLLINAIAPPSTPKSSNAGFQSAPEASTYFIAGATNRIDPFGTIPIVLGKHRMIPPQIKPYTETVGGDQYVRQLFIWGYGEVIVEDIKIGDTPIGEFEDVEIETVYGTDSDPDITLYPGTVDQNDLNVTLNEVDGYQTRTSTENADELSVDITFPQGLVQFSGSGTKLERTVQVEVQYSPTGAGTWSAATGTVGHA